MLFLHLCIYQLGWGPGNADIRMCFHCLERDVEQDTKNHRDISCRGTASTNYWTTFVNVNISLFVMWGRGWANP